MPGLSTYFHTSRAYLVGIQHYKTNQLYTPLNDVRALANVLPLHDFPPENIVTVEDPGKEAFETLITQMQAAIKKNDRVLFYFAGHGVAAASDDEPRGWLLPADAGSDLHSYIDMGWLMKELSKLDCRHLLLIFDCCFAGAVRWAENFRSISRDNPKKLYREKFDRFVHDYSWQVITSSSYDERALDYSFRLGQRDKKDQQHSPFAGALIDLLGAHGRSDTRFPDGIITATRLYDALDTRLAKDLTTTGHTQSPSYFPLRKHKKGQFIFLQPGRYKYAIDELPKRTLNNPYKGLASYTGDDTHLFFGRTAIIQAVKNLVGSSGNKPVIIAGASGVGKSSLIQAGVQPQLRAQYPVFVTVRPGQIRTDPALLTTIRTILWQDQPFIVFIDQFEELVTVCVEEERTKWSQFITTVTYLMQGKILIGIRTDLEAQMQDLLHDQFPGAERYVVLPMARTELEEVIMGPASQEAILIRSELQTDEGDDVFINRIIDEALQSPGSLPLLSYALEEWYELTVKEGQDRWTMKEQIYLKIGGVTGALTKIMTDFVTPLADQYRQVLRNMIIRMVSFRDNHYTRKSVTPAELDYADPNKSRIAATLLPKLMTARIITTNDDPASVKPEQVFYEPAHDSVIGSWLQLQVWVNEEQEKIATYQRLAESVRRWTTAERSKKKELLWNPGNDFDTVIRDLNQLPPTTSRRLPVRLTTRIFFGAIPRTAPDHHFFLSRTERLFIDASTRRLRTNSFILSGLATLVLAAALVVGLVIYNKNLTTQALFINSTAEGNSPTEKLLLLKRAYELDPKQAVTKDNIVRLLNASPSYYSPFARSVLYHRGGYGRNIIPNPANDDYITIADSSLVWWDRDQKKLLRRQEKEVITGAGFLNNTEPAIYYTTFSGRLTIVNRNGDWLNQKDSTKAGSQYTGYLNSRRSFLLISTSGADSPDIIATTLDSSGHLRYRDTLRGKNPSTFRVYPNEHAGEIYLYDTRSLLIFNYAKRSWLRYSLWEEPVIPDGAVDLSKGPVANDMPVFRFSADGRAFLYKPLKDSVFYLTLSPDGPVRKKLHPSINDAGFIDTTRNLLLLDDKGITKVDTDFTVTGSANVDGKLIALTPSDSGRLFLAEDADGNGYLYDAGLTRQLTIDKSYNFSEAVIRERTHELLLTGRSDAFYLFDLDEKNFLFQGNSLSSVLPLPGRSAFVTWSADNTELSIVGTDGNSWFPPVDADIVNVFTNAASDRIFVLTLKNYSVISPTGKLLFKKDFPVYSNQQDAISIPQSDRFVLYYDTVIRIISNDLRLNRSYSLHEKVRDIIPAGNGQFLVLTANGTVTAFDENFTRKWGFADQRLSVNFFGDKLIYQPPLVYKISSDGGYLSFDTTGKFQRSGSLSRNTSFPGGNFVLGPTLDRYLFSPPNLYLNQQNIEYSNVLYDKEGRQLFNYRFNKVVSGLFIDADHLLFQTVKNYEVFTQFTPEGALKKFRQLQVHVIRDDGK